MFFEFACAHIWKSVQAGSMVISCFGSDRCAMCADEYIFMFHGNRKMRQWIVSLVLKGTVIPENAACVVRDDDRL